MLSQMEVIINLANGLSLNGVSTIGDAGRPQWIRLNVAMGDVKVNGRSALYAAVLAPTSQVGIFSNARLRGGLMSDWLALNSRNSVLEVTPVERNRAGPSLISS